MVLTAIPVSNGGRWCSGLCYRYGWLTFGSHTGTALHSSVQAVVFPPVDTGPQAPSVTADKASATRRVVTFCLIFYFGGLTPKDLIFV